MKTLCLISDTHRGHRALTAPECDVLIHCGDFYSFQREDETTPADADEWFVEVSVNS